jgi:hypothetical protein
MMNRINEANGNDDKTFIFVVNSGAKQAYSPAVFW